MSKTIINVSNDFFDVGGSEGDVMYNFKGNSGIKSNSVLYGKIVNLSEMYDTMLSDVREFLFGGEFVSIVDKIVGKAGIPDLVNKYTFKKYGITIETVYNKIHGNIGDIGIGMTTDVLFNELKVKYGITAIDWMYLYDNVNQFVTNDVDILEYIANRILGNDFYNYFVANYNLQTVGVVKKVTPCIRNNVSIDESCNLIKMEWNNGCIKEIQLSSFVKSYKQWWNYMTKKSNNRGDIKDYDLLLNGRSVTDVFPLYCPVFNNLRLNYTGIDFDNGGKNIKKCSEIAGYSDKGETWSFASIDRIDSNKGYSYDNIRIISHYANNLKNVGNIDQLRRLLRYMDEQNSYF